MSGRALSGRAVRGPVVRAAVAVTCALLLAACGAASPPPSAAAPTDRVEVVSWWTSGSEHAALERLFTAFTTANRGVTVVDGAVAGGGGSNVAVVLSSRLRAGNPPDVWQTFVGSSLGALAGRQRVVDVSPIYTGGLAAAMVPAIRDAVTTNGRQYGVPSGSHRQNVLWYNRALLTAAGIAEPGPGYTVAAWLADLDTLRARGTVPLCLGAKDRFAVAELFENILLGTVGPGGWPAVTGDAFDWSGPQATAALATFGAVLDRASPTADARTWDQATGQLGKGECAFEAFNDSAYGELISTGAAYGRDFGAVPFPGTEPGYLAVVDTFVLADGAPDPRNGYEFLRTVADPAATVAFNQLKGSVPVRTDVDPAALSPYQRSAYAALRGQPTLLSITHGEVRDAAFQQGFYDAVTSYRADRDPRAFVAILRDAVNRTVPFVP